jgi:uncharacterized protein (DUF1501 family)
MLDSLSRRDFLARTGAVAIGLAAPGWLGSLARAESALALKGRRPPSDRTLVVLQLSGGNDGLNTLIPYRDPRYAALRPTLAVPADRVLDVDGRMALHPALEPLHGLLREGRAAAVQRLEESRRIRLAYLAAFPDAPFLAVNRIISDRFRERFGDQNAIATYLFGLYHEWQHYDQFREVLRQALASARSGPT